ncbi:PP2C family protein-serine/threonine phosphatase [Nocardioides marmotae]|uniref:PP2C family protein-serine/threonine phosphatase n=1 Tax=Nocardioides marmotae TaxID=2663857 RepID=UPI00132A4CA8|nr:protein phosphatase 2C domain-containing protein [Nocardioides marmotae]MBC9732355.1 serine/threonine-protein phosphatase [Nocardioides marmotae]MTB83476.1 serine/threonine-protein phosphatase [Nocardioides marmotae]
MSLRLHWSAISDVGRVRKDNQDSGYAGPWLLTVCDGVGGAARGDIASSTAVAQLRRLDEQPTGEPEDLLGLVSGALHRAHDRINDLVEEDPSLNGTSTTATVALFDGRRIAVGHVGDSRAYLWRDGEISQLTKDHTFVQSLIDEGRISEAEARVHPHRNLILKALGGPGDVDPDLFLVDLVAGDRLLLCSDGASGVLDDSRLGALLADGTPDYAAVELVRASLEAGSSDNVTCIVADVLAEEQADVDPAYAELEPMLVGAAAELRRRPTRGAKPSGLFRARAGDTGELDPVPADVPDDVPFAIPSDPIDPEAARYAPRPPRRLAWLRPLFGLLVLGGVLWMTAAAAWAWSQDQYFVGEEDGTVVIFRGLNTDLPGVSLNEPYETTDVELDRLSDFDAGKVQEGIEVGDLDDARRAVDNLAARQSDTPTDATSDDPTDPADDPTGDPTDGATQQASQEASPAATEQATARASVRPAPPGPVSGTGVAPESR